MVMAKTDFQVERGSSMYILELIAGISIDLASGLRRFSQKEKSR